MEKRTFLAVLLSLLILIIYPYIIVRFFPQYVSSPQKEVLEEVKEEETALAPLTSETSLLSPFSRSALPFSVSEKEKVFENDNFRIVFSNYGGAIKEIELKKYRLNNQPLLLVKARERDQYVFADKDVIYKQAVSSDSTVTYTADLDGQFQISKEYFISPEGYFINLNLSIRNLTSYPQQFSPLLSISSPVSQDRFSRRFSEICLANDTIQRRNISRLKKEYIKKGDFSWVGINKKYFCLILKHLAEDKTEKDVGRIKAGFASEKEDDNLLLSAEIEPFIIPAEQEISQEFILYAGPKATEELTKADKDFVRIINYGFFSGISRLILITLKFFYKIGHNYGLAIILLAILINLFLQPLTLKSFRSMKDMQRIQPHINRLREEHKENPHKLNEEIRNLFRKHNVNPLAGCLPILLQIPIFIALYQGLMRSLELRGAHFIFWIKDLSQPDALRLPFSLPLIGDKINVLPILMAIAMGWQQRLSSPRKESPTEAEKHQQKMALIMPAIFALIFYSMPSGLVLYWLVNTLIAIFYQRRIR